jgi:hypothetical protein
VLCLHRDERGTISILTLTTIIGLMMLMGMVINIGRHIDDKVKMQNAVDAAAYSGGTVLARGMNSIAFTNHLLCDVFALTAFMREARDRNAESLTGDVLNAWATIGPIFEGAQFAKFKKLGPAITQKVPLEKELVRSYSEMSAAISELVLPVLEYVLRERLIPEFQRSVVQTMPQLAQQATNEVARRHGQKQPQRPQMGMLWRTNYQLQPVGYPDERDPLTRTLPAVDPTPLDFASGGGGQSVGEQSFPTSDPHPDPLEGLDSKLVPDPGPYLMQARSRRELLAQQYLDDWNNDRLRFFSYEGKMSQFINLWKVFTCGQLQKLLIVEYPLSNLPHVIRLTDDGEHPNDLKARQSESQYKVHDYLDRNFMFVGIAYRKKFTESFNGLFKNPLNSDPLTFAQIHLFIPRARLWNPTAFPNVPGSPTDGFGGGAWVDVPGAIPPTGPSSPSTNVNSDIWPPDYGWSEQWDLFNQNWTVQLVPATTENLAALIQANPPAGALQSSQSVTVQVPRLGGVTSKQIRQINGH